MENLAFPSLDLSVKKDRERIEKGQNLQQPCEIMLMAIPSSLFILLFERNLRYCIPCTLLIFCCGLPQSNRKELEHWGGVNKAILI